MSLPRFHVPGAGPDRLVALPEDEAHHLRHVLRLAAGDEVVIFDGRGHEWRARVASIGRAGAAVELVEPRTPAAEPPVAVTVGLSLLKGDHMDAAIRDATALGAAAIAPMTAARIAVSSRAARAAGALARWRRVAVAAAKQSGRAVVPAIGDVTAFAECLDAHAAGVVVMTVEPSSSAAPADLGPRPASALILIGPEGGWSPEEIDFASRRGARHLRLGARTIRADLMPAVVLASVWTRWGWDRTTGA